MLQLNVPMDESEERLLMHIFDVDGRGQLDVNTFVDFLASQCRLDRGRSKGRGEARREAGGRAMGHTELQGEWLARLLAAQSEIEAKLGDKYYS